MEVYLIVSIVDRVRSDDMRAIYESAGLQAVLTLHGRGTANTEHLALYGLQATSKSVLVSFAVPEQVHRIEQSAKVRFYIDVPGHGILMTIPIKSVGGGKTLAFMTNQAEIGPSVPDFHFDHELILVILNEGYTDDVMNTARAAGARGGTILHAKGTGAQAARAFLGVSLASEKEILLIVAPAADKAAIMQAVAREQGPGTASGAIVFSLPVSSVSGLKTGDSLP